MIRVLWSGVDTLEASFRGKLSEETQKRLEAAKQKAQEENLGEPFSVGSVELLAQPTGLKPWSYVLSTEDLQLRVSAAKTVPTVSARLLALGLVAYGHEPLYSIAEELAAVLGGKPAGLSRLDLAVDFQGHAPTAEEMRHVVCASHFRPVYPSYDNPETFQFGKGGMVVRLYNKTKELLKSDKGWLRAVWAQEPSYRPEEDVWRFEAQFRREILKACGFQTVEGTFDGNLSTLLAFALCWCSPRLPVETNLARCPVAPWWEELKAASFAGNPCTRAKAESYVGSFERLLPQSLGLLVSGAAHLGVYDFERALQLQRRELEAYIDRSGVSFAERVKARRRRIKG